MKLFKLALVFLFVALLVVACGKSNAPTTNVSDSKTPAATPKNDEWAAARSLYQATCVNCHKADGTGGSVTFAEGDPPLKVPTLKSEKQANEPDAEYIEQIKEGGDGMPAFKKRLNDGQIAQRVAYIRHEFQGKDVKLPQSAAAPDKPAVTPDKAAGTNKSMEASPAPAMKPGEKKP